VEGYNNVWDARSFVYYHKGVVWEATVMCGMQGLLCIIIGGCAGGYKYVWDTRSFVYCHKRWGGRLQ
jgi:hypothetical protein